MNNELDNEIKVIVNGEERKIKLSEEGSLKEGEILYKENDKWYVKKINFKTIPITKEDYEIENERLNNIIDELKSKIDTLLEINEKYEVEDTKSLYSKKWLRETLEEFKGVINER